MRFRITVSRSIQALGYNVADLRALIERAHRVLEDHLNITGDLLVFFPAEFSRDSLSVKKYFALCDRVDADNSAADRGFAGTGFTDEAEGLSLVNVKTYIVNRGERVTVGAELHADIFDFQEFFVGNSFLLRCCACRGGRFSCSGYGIRAVDIAGRLSRGRTGNESILF